VILAGIINQVDDHIFDKLDSIVSKKISEDKVYFKNKFVKVVAGKTSDIVDQGSILTVNGALLIGKVFNKRNYGAITIKELEREVEASNEHFVKKYWGNYISIKLHDETVKILRDPVGQFPFFYMKLDSGECLFASEMEILIDIIKKPGFNWKYFSSYVIHGFITTEETAFDGIYELPHGCQMAYDFKTCITKTSVVWNPLDYIGGYRNTKSAIDDIVNITSNVIEKWTAGFEVVSLDFSGGTDSTGILFLLNKILHRNQELKLINMFHPEVLSSDERKYAYEIAKGLGIDLIEFDHSKSLPYDSDYSILSFKPNWPTSLLSYLKINNDISFMLNGNKNKNIIYMSGHGGDHIFLCPPPITSLCDYLIEQGAKGFNTKVNEIYEIFRKPLLPIISDMAKGFIIYYLYSSYEPSAYAINAHKKAPWFNENVLLLEKQIRYHPFFYNEKTTKSLPGKFGLIDAIYSGLSTIKSDIRDYGVNPVFFPLFSQPLLELALSIPTYDTYRNGYNRYPFRKAISDTFKTNAVWRRDKGETSGISQRGLKKNEKRIFDLCLEGNMVKQGLLNKDKLYSGLHEVINGQKDYQWSITNLICAETFMNYWV